MGKAKKAKNAAMSQDRLNLKARAAAGAKATAGRSRIFADKGDILAKNKGDADIAEGMAEYNEKKNEVVPQPPSEQEMEGMMARRFAPVIQPTCLNTVNIIQYMTRPSAGVPEITELCSFPESPEGNKAAEQLFRGLCNKYGPQRAEVQSDEYLWSGEDVETMIEDGWAEYKNWKVVLFHSTPPDAAVMKKGLDGA